MMSEKKTIPTPLEILNEFSNRGLPEHFCIVPFTNMIFNPDGKVGVCRQKGTEHFVGDITQNTVEEIWNNDYVRNWRREFLTGDIRVCKKEIERTSCHLSMDNYTLWDSVDLSEVQSGPMLKLTANFNGKCNLRCKMCHIWTMRNGLYDEINFWELAEEQFFPHIKEVEMLSGEPFIQEDTYRLIDELSAVNPDCLWSFTTNGHWKLNQRIKDSLDKINVKNIIISIDSLRPEIYSEIRIDGKLQTVLDNLDLLLDYNQERLKKGKSSLELTLHYLVMRENWDELEELVQFVEEKGLRLTIDNLYEPAELAISSLPEDDQLAMCEHYLKKLNWNQATRLMRFFTAVASNLTGIHRASLLDQLNRARSK
jgi:MoaA/NifB/PqqE/SkfB family radical SAM enzyme